MRKRLGEDADIAAERRFWRHHRLRSRSASDTCIQHVGLPGFCSGVDLCACVVSANRHANAAVRQLSKAGASRVPAVILVLETDPRVEFHVVLVWCCLADEGPHHCGLLPLPWDLALPLCRLDVHVVEA